MQDNSQTMDIQKILSLLPHRYPFLLVDRVVECVPGSHIRAYKNVTFNEPFFQGHFPGNPIMPGVLICEALAQAGAVLELPYIYYSGYTVTLENNNTEKELKTYESKKGFVEVHLEESVEAGTIKVEYTGTNIMKISIAVSILAFTVMVVYIILSKQKSVES